MGKLKALAALLELIVRAYVVISEAVKESRAKKKEESLHDDLDEIHNGPDDYARRHGLLADESDSDSDSEKRQ